MLIFPAILTDSADTLRQQLAVVQESGLFQTVQVDIIDGYFTDSITVTPADLADCDWGDLNVDIHLMTVDPIDYVFELVEFKKQIPVRSVITQVEKMSAQQAFITEVRKHDWLVGFSLDLFTTLEAIEQVVRPQLDIVQVMGNEAGQQGLSLHKRALVTIQELAAAAQTNDYQWDILCDIGVNRDTLKQVETAGATGALVGSALWKAEDFNQAALELIEM
ncbi:hypothetical protein KBC79_06495 [Candidatus Woesebacteria bacterium]|nr:hypothetical protein [Candidatus Woesebacteria bacterium]